MYLLNLDVQKKGQIAHLNRDRSDSRFENLVYLCLDHHDDYDSRTSQSKGLLVDEVREYRDRLYAKYHVDQALGERANSATDIENMPSLSEYDDLRKRFPAETDRSNSPWRFPLWQVANEPELFAYKPSNGMDAVCLIERIDLPDGRIVIACMSAKGSPGQSITNAVEELCFQVCERFEIPSGRLVWLEHYDTVDDAEWNLVTFRKTPPENLFDDPEWTRMTTAMWGDLKLLPKTHMKFKFGSYESKLTKLFPWPPDDNYALL